MGGWVGGWGLKNSLKYYSFSFCKKQSVTPDGPYKGVVHISNFFSQYERISLWGGRELTNFVSENIAYMHMAVGAVTHLRLLCMHVHVCQYFLRSEGEGGRGWV